MSNIMTRAAARRSRTDEPPRDFAPEVKPPKLDLGDHEARPRRRYTPVQLTILKKLATIEKKKDELEKAGEKAGLTPSQMSKFVANKRRRSQVATASASKE
uniref:Homeobox domain-containing protein n=1 Tax=Steinernema glaseri TaxID=37863 RepID=A0A1I7Y6G8_9BILA